MTADTVHLPVRDALDRRAALHRLLDDSLAWAPEHGAGMASHLPMALAALDGLGAHPEQMASFAAQHARRLDRAAVAPPAAAVDDWRPLRGRFADWPALRATFARRIARAGVDAVLREAVPALVDGVAGAAFHGPIRVAHAVEAAHAGELAAALAYWAARWEPLPPPASPARRIAGVPAWLDALDARRLDFDPAWRADAPLISARMQQAARTPPYRELAGALAADGAGPAARLAELALACAARYAASGNFTVLHMATASRALRVLAPWLPAGTAALAPLLHAVAAASLAARAAPLSLSTAAAARSRADVRRIACASDDDHVIKLVHAAVLQNAERPDAVWLAAARTATRG